MRNVKNTKSRIKCRLMYEPSLMSCLLTLTTLVRDGVSCFAMNDAAYPRPKLVRLGKIQPNRYRSLGCRGLDFCLLCSRSGLTVALHH